MPASWSTEIDVDDDGDDDRGDTLCVVGAWDEGSPLFGAALEDTEEDSGTIESTEQSWNLPDLGATAYVRVRLRDESGTWSAWSDGFDAY